MSSDLIKQTVEMFSQDFAKSLEIDANIRADKVLQEMMLKTDLEYNYDWFIPEIYNHPELKSFKQSELPRIIGFFVLHNNNNNNQYYKNFGYNCGSQNHCGCRSSYSQYMYTRFRDGQYNIVSSSNFGTNFVTLSGKVFKMTDYFDKKKSLLEFAAIEKSLPPIPKKIYDKLQINWICDSCVKLLDIDDDTLSTTDLELNKKLLCNNPRCHYVNNQSYGQCKNAEISKCIIQNNLISPYFKKTQRLEFKKNLNTFTITQKKTCSFVESYGLINFNENESVFDYNSDLNYIFQLELLHSAEYSDIYVTSGLNKMKSDINNKKSEEAINEIKIQKEMLQVEIEDLSNEKKEFDRYKKSAEKFISDEKNSLIDQKEKLKRQMQIVIEREAKIKDVVNKELTVNKILQTTSDIRKLIDLMGLTVNSEYAQELDRIERNFKK